MFYAPDERPYSSNRGMHTMAQANSNRTTKPTGFLNAVARIHLSHLFQDPFVAAAFKAAEDDGLAPELVEVDRPKTLDGGAAERLADGPARSRNHGGVIVDLRARYSRTRKCGGTYPPHSFV